MDENMKTHAEALAKKAADTANAAEALHFSQGALNIANAMCALKTAEAIKT